MTISNLAAVALASLLFSQGEGIQTLLAAIPVDAAAELDWSQPVFVEARVKDPAALKRGLSGEAAITASGESLRFELRSYRAVGEPPTPETQRASFIVDYDEPSLLSIQEELLTAHGPTPSIRELIEFVSEVIVTKSYARGWDIASRVARDRTGDCTEHAVLLTALARASGYGARIVVGTAIIVNDGKPAAFGHAWSEIYRDAQWVIADAALVGIEVPVHYIRGGVVEDESISFTFGLFGLTDAVSIHRLRLSNAKQ